MSTAAAPDLEVGVVGAGVVGSAVALELARRGVGVALLEAEPAPGLAASGTNSGILHTGFDSVPGELETEMILASGPLREPLLEGLAIPVLRCGALMSVGTAGTAAAFIVARARENGVVVHEREGGVIEVPGEWVTDPVTYTVALAAAAGRHGAEVHAGFRVSAIEPGSVLTVHAAGGVRLRCRFLVNCAGLRADAVARMLGDESFSIYPRKGEFVVFEPPDGQPLEHVLLPVPSKRTKGVLVFPTIDGKVIAGPTAVDLEDKDDWSVRPKAAAEILPKALELYPALEGVEPIASYAGLRPAGRGTNYLIGVSPACERVVNVAAIRSTGLSASLGIARLVAEIVGALGVSMSRPAPLVGGPVPVIAGPWWRRVAEHRAVGALG